MRPDVCYIVSHGFAARMILHSDVIPQLRALDLSVALVVPDADEPPLQAFARRHGIRLVTAPPGRRRTGLLPRARSYFLEDIAANPALRAKHERSRDGRAAVPDLSLWLNRHLVRSHRVASWFGQVERALLADERAARILADLAPGIVVATYPANTLEASFLHEAERAGIPTVGQLLSWDNISCKGRFAVPPGHYVSWGPIMSAELAEHYRVPAERVHECGVAHFDAHVKAPTAAAQAAILARLGLDPARPYALFGMSSPYFAPHEIDIVEWLAGRLRAGAFGADLQLVVRPHPQNMTGHMSDRSWLDRLDALAGPRVAIDRPAMEESKLLWAVKEADLPHLANLLAGCAVCLNSGSTFSIDGIIHDKPVLLTCFDADHQLPWWRSARRALDYPHMAKLVALGGVRPVHDLASLERELQADLRDASRDAEGRRRTRAAEVGTCDGRASERVAAALRAIRRGATCAERTRAAG